MANDRIVILSTHIIEDVQSICNRLIILNEGKVIYDDPPEKLISLAQNHVAIINEKDLNQTNEKILVAARMNTINGVRCRIVSQELPDNAIKVDPSLEDAYLYILSNSN
jgi:ABC-type multidrug transport system ATPase subunit